MFVSCDCDSGKNSLRHYSDLLRIPQQKTRIASDFVEFFMIALAGMDAIMLQLTCQVRNNMSKLSLGTLETIPLKSVWAHEEYDFTPWLLANADELGKVIGINLELHEAEHPVGNYSLDLIGIDLDSNRRVIVENQITKSDHTHLGQVLTYAGGTEAAIVIWVAESFREEHLAAFRWLNARTDSFTQFFAVSVSAVRIGSDGPVAPLFTIEEKPNDWGKAIKSGGVSSTGSSAPSATNVLYQEFWRVLLDRMKERGVSLTNAKAGQPQSWMAMPYGFSPVWLAASFSPKGLRAEIYLGDKNTALNSERFEILLDDKQKIESEVGHPLEWENMEGKKACRIASYFPGASIPKKDDWDTYADWFLNELTAIKNAFVPYKARLQQVTEG